MFPKRNPSDSLPLTLPRAQRVAPPPDAFVLWPAAAGFTPVQQLLYQKAFEQAQAVVQPSILERDLVGVWN